MKNPSPAVLAALAAWVMVSACGCPDASYTGVPIPPPPAANVRAELFFKPIHPILAEYAQFIRVTTISGNDTSARDYPLRLNSGGQFKVNLYLLPADAAGGPYFRFEEAYGHYLLDLTSGAWYLVGPPMETNRTGDRQPQREILYYHGTAIPREVSLTEAKGAAAGAGTDFGEDNDPDKLFSGAVTERDGKLVYGGAYYGCATVDGFTGAAAAPEARVEVFVSHFSPTAPPMAEVPLPCPGADGTVFYAYEPRGGSRYDCAIKITGSPSDLVARFAMGIDRGAGANLFAYPAANTHGPRLRLVNNEAELLIDPRRQRIRVLGRARGRVYLGERMEYSLGTRETETSGVEVTLGDQLAPLAPADVAAGPGTYLGRIDDSADTLVFIPASVAPERAIPRPEMYLDGLGWPYDTVQQKLPKTVK